MQIKEENIEVAIKIISKLTEDCLKRNKIKYVNIIYDEKMKPEIDITFNSGYVRKMKDLDKIIEFIKNLK